MSANYLGVSGSSARARLNLLEDSSNGNRMNNCAGSLGRRGSGGTSILTPRNPKSTSALPAPFDLRVSVDIPDSEINVTIVPGTVNGLLPSNIFATITEPYNAMSPITYYATVACVTDGENITGVRWGLSTSMPTGQTAVAWAAPSAFSYLFGIIVGASIFRTIARTSLVFQPSLVVSVPKSVITPNIIPYDNYYNWLPVNGTG